MSYLSRFPVHFLKIPKNFIDDIANDADVAALTDGIVQLAHSLELAVVAEGIESPEQAEYLRRIQVQLGQGFSYGKPLDEQAAGALLTEQHRTQQHEHLDAREPAAGSAAAAP